MDLSIAGLIAAMLLVLFGSLVQSAIGFGLAILAAPLLFLIDPRLVPGPVLVLAMVLSVANVWKNHADLAFGELSSAIVGRIPGMALALWLLTWASTEQMSLLVGGAVLAAIAISLTPVRIEPTPRRLLGVGAVSGFMGTATSIGGPPMALIYQHATGARIRANLGAYFLISSIMSLLGLALIGRFGWVELQLSLYLLPACLLGFVAGRYVLPWIGPGVVRPVLLVICAIAAIGVLASGL